jgi:hypothetical protein
LEGAARGEGVAEDGVVDEAREEEGEEGGALFFSSPPFITVGVLDEGAKGEEDNFDGGVAATGT